MRIRWNFLSNKGSVAPYCYLILQISLLSGAFATCQYLKDMANGQIFSLAVFWLNVVCVIVFYFVTHLRDPGYVPHDAVFFTDQEEEHQRQTKSPGSIHDGVLQDKHFASVVEIELSGKVQNHHRGGSVSLAILNRQSVPTEGEMPENIDFENMIKDDEGPVDLENDDSTKPRSLKGIIVEENEEEHAEDMKPISNTPKRIAASYHPGVKHEDNLTIKRYHSAGGSPIGKESTNSQVEIEIQDEHKSQSNSGQTLQTQLPQTTDKKEPPVRNSKQNYLQFSDENEHNQSPGGQERRESATKKRISQTGSNSSTTAKSNESPYQQISGTEREQQIKERASKGQKEPSNLIEVQAFRNSPKLENELDDKLECENYEGKKSGDSFSFTVERRYCTVCNLEQPFRAKHCKLCNRCVCSYDHHCPWLGTCIGERNHLFFFWFLFFQLIEALWVEINIIRSFSDDVDDPFSIAVPRAVVFGINAFFVFMVGSLLGFHAYLATQMLTTWESLSWDKISYLKEWPEERGSPFTMGCMKNTHYFFCESYKQLRRWRFPKMRQVSSPYQTKV